MKQSRYTLMKKSAEHKSGFWVRLFLMIFMGLTSFGGWAQGYTVIYPDGKTMAEPGDVVTVVFDEDMSNYYYGFTHKNYCEDSTEIGKRTIWFASEGYETGEATSPLDCADDYLSLDKINNISIDESNFNVLKVTIPEEHKLSTYDVYFGEKEDVKVFANGWGNCFLTMCSIQDRNKCKKWTKTFTPHGSFRINVVSENLTIRSENCYCPGNVFRFTLENNGYGDNLVWTYDTGTESGEFTPTKVAENVYEYEIPANFIDGVKISCRGNVANPDIAEVNLFVCPPKIVPQRECVDVDKITSVIIENACPSLSYTIVDKKTNAEVWPASTGEVNYGEPYYLASFSVGEFEEEVDENKEVVGHRPKDFGVYANGRLLTSFQVKDCDNWIESCAEYTPGDFSDCSIAFDGFDSKVSFVPSGGTPTDTVISFYKIDDSDWQSVNNNSRLEPCHTYQIRTNIYIDNINVGYCDSKPFEVNKPGGNQGPQVAADYNKEVIAVSNGNCEFSVPDLTDSVKKYVTDECEFVVTQDVSVGEIVSIGSPMQVVATVIGKCASPSLTFYVNAPEALVIENVSSEVSCDDENSLGKISGSIKGGVGSFTVTAAKIGGEPVDGSKISLPERNFTITDLELGEYEVTVTDANGCFKTDTVSVTFTPQELTITGENIEKIYNGQPQSAEATAENYQVEGLLQGDEITSITFIQDNPLTDVGEISYSIKNVEIKRGEATVTCFYDIAATGATFKVVPRPVTLTSSDSTKVYDGEALTNGEVTISGDGFVAGEATYKATGSQTEVGSSKNTIVVEEGENFKAENYVITKEEGTLLVTEFTDKVTVTITENKGSEKYDGTEKTVTGYTVTSVSNELYTVDDFTFSGDATVKGTDAGSYDMELTAENFTNISNNFTNVEFVIVDGTLEISKRTVTLTSADAEKVYDGTALTNDKVTVGGDGFVAGEATATAIGSQTEVGESTNTIEVVGGANFKEDNYDITKEEGMLTVTSRSVIVTITENGDTLTYNGQPQSVSGYSVTEISSPLYTEDDFKFNGIETVSGTNVGAYHMMLQPSDFENTNPNFDVEFVVVDDSLVIIPLEVTVTITGNTSTEVYNGTQHTLTGYTWTPDNDLYEADFFEYAGDSITQGVNVGDYPMNLTPEDFSNTNDNFVVDFIVVDGKLSIIPTDALTIIAKDSTKMYDGTPLVQPDYILEGALADGDELFVTTEGEITDFGTAVNKIASVVVKRGEEDVTDNYQFNKKDGLLSITKRSVVLTSKKDTTVYNGKFFSSKDVAVSGDGWAEREKFDFAKDILFYDFTDSLLYVGEVNNNFSVNSESEEVLDRLKNNYVIDYDYGVLVVNKRSVVLISASDTKEYDGTPLTNPNVEAKGYGFVEGDEVTYNVEGTITNVGTVNNSFTYTFVDDKVKSNYDITKVEGVLIVTPNTSLVVNIIEPTDTFEYNGETHFLRDFEVVTNMEEGQYTASDFVYSGVAEVSGSLVGKYSMDLQPSQFTNINKNFDEVQFNVISKDLVIKPRENVVVEIKENGANVVYDGKLHEVNGYVFHSNDPLYLVEYMRCNNLEAAHVEGTEVGVYDMELLPSYFENTNPNFTNVEFVIVDSALTIFRQEGVVVTITEKGAVETYDSNEKVVSGYSFSSSSDAYTVADFKFEGDSVVKGTDAGTYHMELKPSDFVNINENFSDVKFVVKDDSLQILPLDGVVVTIEGNSEIQLYDGSEIAVSGYEITPSVDFYGAADFVFTGDSIAEGVKVGLYQMQMTPEDFKNVNPNFTNVKFVVDNGQLEIIPLSDVVVTIKLHGDKVVYDGTAHKVTGYDIVSISSDLYKESDFRFIGTSEDSTAVRTDVGSTMMNVTSSSFENENKNFGNVRFVVVMDSLEITPNKDVIVKVYENHGEFVYDGEPHKAEGYRMEANNELYDVNNVVFSGVAEVTGTNVGSYQMDLKASDFSNVDKNFADVKFVIVDDSLVIKPLESVVVTVVGNSEDVYYDGFHHIVRGYLSITSDNEYYNVESSVAILKTNPSASGVNVGKYPMGILPSDFKNINPNFKNVTFVVEDGYLSINKFEQPIVITANSKSKKYDGTPLESKGYSYTLELLQSTDKLVAIIEGSITEVGEVVNKVVSHRILNRETGEDVTNNYVDVVYEDGKLEITPRHLILHSGSEEKIYDGTELTKNHVAIGGDSLALGDSIIYMTTGEQLYAGESDNTFEYLFRNPTAYKNYDVDIIYGTLKVNPIPDFIDIVAGSSSKDFDKKPLVDSTFKFTQGILVEGDSLVVKLDGIITEVGVTDNAIVDYYVLRDGVDVTHCYTFGDLIDGLLEIRPADLPFIIYGDKLKIVFEDIHQPVRVYDMLGRGRYKGTRQFYVKDYYELPVEQAGVYIVRILGKSYKVIVHD